MPRLFPHVRLFKATLIALTVSALTIGCGSVALADTITVTSDLDTEVAGDGACTLREALTNANNDSDSTATDCTPGSGADTIEFNIGGGGAQTISLGSALPTISTPMHINGSSQPGYAGAPLIHIDYSNNALFLAGASSTMVEALELSWSGASRSGTGLRVGSSSAITVTNVIANNRSFGIAFDANNTDVWVLDNDLSDNNTALYLNAPLSGILPGGMQISGNNYADSGTGISIASAQTVVVSDGSTPGTNVLVAPADGLTAATTALRFNGVSNSTVTGLDVSWSGGSRSGTGLLLGAGSLITVTNMVATNRTTGASFSGITDFWVEGNDLSNNGTALSVNSPISGILPGGMQISNNNYADSGVGILINSTQDVTVSDGSAPETNVVVVPADGLMDTSGYALRFNQVSNGLVTELDLSWPGGARSGTALGVTGSSLITVTNVAATNRVTGIAFNGITDVWLEGNDLSGNTTALSLVNVQQGVLPGGLWVADNSYVDSVIGLSIQTAQNVIVSDGSAPGTNVVVAPADGLTATAGVALNLYQVNNAMVTGLDLSWSGGARSGTGLQVRASSLITTTNLTANNRVTGITFNNNTDLWVEDNDLAGNHTALNLSNTLAGGLPGGMWVSGNSVGGSAIGLVIQAAQDITVADGSVPGTNVVVAHADGFVNTSDTALRFNQVTNGVVDGLDLSWSGSARSGTGLLVQASANFTATTLIATNRTTGIRFVDVVASQGTCSYVGNNQYGMLVDNDFTGLALFDNYISGNTSAGLFNNELATLSAPNNYWGAADGPSTDGGSGDAYGGAINAAPFSTAPAACLNAIIDWDTLPTSYGDTVHIRTDTLQVGAGGILDDGATFPALPAAGIYTASITVTNTSGQAAQLVGWIDLNGNGVFEQPTERSSADLFNGSGDATDGTFTTGNIPNGVVDALAILQWTVTDPPVAPTYARIRLTTDAEFFSDASPQPSGGYGAGESEVHTVSAGTVPVTVGYFLAQPRGDGIEFHWQTATETGTAGFNILAATEAGAVQLNPALIPSQAIDSTEPLDYAFITQTNATSFLLQEMEITGATNEYGPYTLGNAYGARIPTDPVDGWSIYLPFITTR